MTTARVVVGREAAPPRRRRGEGGYVIAEAAVAIPALAVVALALAWALSIASMSYALGDAARQAARDIARGVGVEQALSSAAAGVSGVRVAVEGSGDAVVVTATREVSPPVPLLSGITITLHQSVAVPREWT